jgi:hypothetical protein
MLQALDEIELDNAMNVKLVISTRGEILNYQAVNISPLVEMTDSLYYKINYL